MKRCTEQPPRLGSAKPEMVRVSAAVWVVRALHRRLATPLLCVTFTENGLSGAD